MATRQKKAEAPITFDSVLERGKQELPLTAKELALLADTWFATMQDRLAADKKAAALKSTETLCQTILIAQLRAQELTAIGGSLVRVSIDSEPEYQPHVKDWNEFYKFILQTQDFSLLERRPGKAACRERWAVDGDSAVPGVEKFPVYKLRRNEVK
jgi:hypothetical protein